MIFRDPMTILNSGPKDFLTWSNKITIDFNPKRNLLIFWETWENEILQSHKSLKAPQCVVNFQADRAQVQAGTWASFSIRLELVSHLAFTTVCSNIVQTIMITTTIVHRTFVCIWKLETENGWKKNNGN